MLNRPFDPVGANILERFLEAESVELRDERLGAPVAVEDRFGCGLDAPFAPLTPLKSFESLAEVSEEELVDVVIGDFCLAGSYVWFADVPFACGGWVRRMGNIVLLRTSRAGGVSNVLDCEMGHQLSIKMS